MVLSNYINGFSALRNAEAQVPGVASLSWRV